MQNTATVTFLLNEKTTTIDFLNSKYTPTTTVLKYLRAQAEYTGTKEGCAEGDCGACTVVIAEPDGSSNNLIYRSINSCLVFLPYLHGKQLITVEGLKNKSQLHPVQQALIDEDASQCGFCTPGFTMSLFSLYKADNQANTTEIKNTLAGNLCRCTGYSSILKAAEKVCAHPQDDHFSLTEQKTIESLTKIKEEQQNFVLQTTDYQYFMPNTVGEAARLKAQYPQASVITGATDIALGVTKRGEHIPQLIDLSAVTELQTIAETDTGFKIGAAVSLEDVRSWSETKFPALYHMLSFFGSKQIRNKATLGGNLGSASPIGDSLPVLLAYQADVELVSENSVRQMPLEEFIVGYRKTLLRKDELIASVKLQQKEFQVKSYKISKRKELDISTVSAGFRVKLNANKVSEIALYFGGMAAQTSRATRVEQFLRNKAWTRENVEAARKLIATDFSPISDARSGAKARLLMAQNLILKFWTETNTI